MSTNNYSFVIDSSFRPFSMEEILTPLTLYKNAYDKTEDAYTELADKSDQFKYLSESLPEDSRARKIYEGYANELAAQANDLASHGLNMANRRALTSLKRRYQGEIGQLEKASTALEKEKELRRQMSTKDNTLLYAVDNLSIDDFLGEKTPNLYSVSGDDLYKRGAQAAQSASSRIYNNTQVSDLTKYYQELVQTQGYRPELLAAFKANMEAIPEFREAVDDILIEKGVGNNLSGVNYERARQSVINGLLDGAVYKEARSVKENPGVMTAVQAASNALGWANHNLSAQQQALSAANNGLIKVGDQYISQDEWMYEHDPQTGQRTGYSEKYKEAVKAGLVPGKNVKMDNSTGGGSTPKPSKESLKKAMSYDKDGNVSTISTGTNNTFLGKPITFSEAVAKNPHIATHHAGFEQYYDYYLNGDVVTVVPRGTTGESTSEENANQADNSGNQL